MAILCWAAKNSLRGTIVTNPYCVIGFDIIQALSSSTTVMISNIQISRYYMQTGQRQE
jgi:hypothetical protein